MKKEIDINIWSEIIKNNSWVALYGAYIFYGDEKFKVKELSDKIADEIYKKHFIAIKSKRDYSREINSNIVGTDKKYNNLNMGWFENVAEAEEKGFKKITLKGKRDIEKRIAEISLEINKDPSDELSKNQEISHDAKSFVISELVEKIKSGEDAQIPTFQREYVWKHEKVAPLLLSLIKNFPIGSMLLWEKEPESNRYTILDGLQRTFSLTLISNHPFAYIDYELFEYVSMTFFEFDSIISKPLFDKLNKEWIKYFNNTNTPENSKTKEKLFEFFRNDFQIKKAVDFIEQKWNSIKDEFQIPFILLNYKYQKDDAADIFAIINTHGVELNNFEVNSSIWSKTQINLDEELLENDFIEEWRRKKYVAYRSKIGVRGKEVFEENNPKTIEPSDFIYSLFDNCSAGKYVIRETFFSDGKLKTSALEPMLTIFITLLGMENEDDTKKDYQSMLPLIGKKLYDEIKTKKDIIDLQNKLNVALSIVENKLVLLRNLVNNSEEKVSINVASSLMSLIINIAIKHHGDKKILDNILYIFIEQFFEGKYGSGSTNNAWSQLHNELYKNTTKERCNEIIREFINKKQTLQNKVESNYDQKFVVILSLFNSKFVNETNDEHMQVDHIIPRSLFIFTGNKNVVDFNYVNSFYNLQLIKKSINHEKSSRIDTSKSEYYIVNKMISEKIDNFSEYKNKYFSQIEKIKRDLCKPNKKDVNKCQKVENPDYTSFKEFIKLQEEYIGNLIENIDLID